MHEVIEKIRQQAQKNPRKIILPEGEDGRVKKAADIILREKIADLILLDKKSLDPKKQKEYALKLYGLRKQKGLDLDTANEFLKNPVFYAAMMVREGVAQGFVAGVVNTTSLVARSAIWCLETKLKGGIVSSAFIMVVSNCEYGEKGVFIYADCGIVPQPTSPQLAQIAVYAAELGKKVLSFEPKVAFLSYSTKHSAEGVSVNKVREAVKLAKELAPDLDVDGELQADAAIVPEVAKIKCSDSKVAGKANILIFPNLDAGNICYKLTERLAEAKAIGPLLMGLKNPCSDLSRGCSVEDIVDCVAVTVIRAQEKD